MSHRTKFSIKANTMAMDADGTLKEGGIVIEDQKVLYSFEDKHPFPALGIQSNDAIVWGK